MRFGTPRRQAKDANMASDNALTLAVVLVAMAGVLIALSLWTVARTVTRLKHPDWSFNAAFGYVYRRGLIAFALTGAVIAAIWFLPWWPPSETPSAMGIRFQLTLFIIVADLFYYYRAVIGQIRKPPG
jgi:uncharacterized BrkB/YihY/UPF0761 family membrane protein